MKQYFDLLPRTLKTFFKKYPPNVAYSGKPTSTTSPVANPFLPNKHPVTNNYHNPKYSLRRMSDLYKLAHQYGVHKLLPATNKLFFEEKYKQKKLMKGVLLPKGHKHELGRDEKLRKMEEAIKNADKYIVEVRGSKYARKLEKKKRGNANTWF